MSSRPNSRRNASRRGALATLTAFFLLLGAPAWACGFLIADNGAIRLGRTTTFVTYADGIEHYVTSFEFQGGGAAFGSLIPLPGEPTSVEKAGDWTLQRLRREFFPPPPQEFAFAPQATSNGDSVEVILEVEIDALDITVLKGGAAAIIDWADEQGFSLPEDSEAMFSIYTDRSPYVMAAKFDPQRADGQRLNSGDATPIHITIPTDAPWIPLQVLGLDKPTGERVVADIFVLTPEAPGNVIDEAGLRLFASEQASDGLMFDLHDDQRSEWIPESGHITVFQLDEAAGDLDYDLILNDDGAFETRDARDRELLASPLNATLPVDATSPFVWLLALVIVFVAGGMASAVGRSATRP